MSRMTIKVEKTDRERDECTFCTRWRTASPELVYWKVSSRHPQRNFVMTLCDICMDELRVQVPVEGEDELAEMAEAAFDNVYDGDNMRGALKAVVRVIRNGR